MKALEILKKIKQDVIEFGDNGGYVRSTVKDFVDLEQALTPPTADEIALMITNAYGEDFLGKWHYNEELKQFECHSGNTHAISPRYEHIKNLWTLDLNERIKVLSFFMSMEETK